MRRRIWVAVVLWVFSFGCGGTPTPDVDRDAGREDAGREDAAVRDVGLDVETPAEDSGSDADRLDATLYDASSDAARPLDARSDTGFVGDGGALDGRVDSSVDSSIDGGTDAGCGPDGGLCPSVPITSLALGTDFTCALLQTGRVFCWGNNNLGQSGHSMGAVRGTPTEILSINTTVSLAAGYSTACAVLSNGTARCWGNGDGNRFGSADYNGPQNTPVEITTPGPVRAFALGESSSCALLTDGTVACAGQNLYGQIGVGSMSSTVATFTRISGLSGVRDLASGAGHVCAIRDDRSVVCWGKNDYAQVDDSGMDRRAPVAVSGIANAVALTARRNRTCARLMDGTARCWGEESGENTTYAGLRDIAAAFNATCAVRTDDTLECRGVNTYGQVGNNSTGVFFAMPVSLPTPFSGARIYAGDYFFCALYANSRIQCWGDNTRLQLSAASTTTCRNFGTDTPCTRAPAFVPVF